MTMGHRSIITIQIPEVVNGKEERLFLSQLEAQTKENRPQIVVDCSRVRRFDKAVVRLLLHTLEHALRRKGDVKLAGLSPDGDAVLEATGASRLFDVYVTTAEAVESFDQIPALALLGRSAARMSQAVSENAA